MTDDRINHPQVEQSVPGGDSDSGEEAAVPVVRAVGRFGRECEPYILPLFPLESEQMMGRDGDGGPPINQPTKLSQLHNFPFPISDQTKRNFNRNPKSCFGKKGT